MLVSVHVTVFCMFLLHKEYFSLNMYFEHIHSFFCLK